MQTTAPRKRVTSAPLPSTTAAAADAAAPRRPRGRPRKSAAAQDDGDRRHAIMDKAARLFLSKSFAATSTRDIAAAVGMHSGSPFYYFESKSALLGAVMSEGMTRALHSQQQALAALPPAASAREQLRALVRHHFEILLGPGSGFIPVMLYEWRSLTPAQRRSIARIKDAYEAAWMPALTALAAQGALQAEPAVARLFIFGALNWAVSWFSPRKGKSLDGLADQAMDLFVRKD